MLRHHFIRRPCAVILLALQASGCYYWHMEIAAPADLIAHNHLGEVRVLRVDGSRLLMANPEVVRDTVWGELVSEPGRPRGPVALKDIASIAAHELDRVKTTSLFVFLAAGVYLIIRLPHEIAPPRFP